MLLKRIGVSNWRSLLNLVEIGPFSEKLNVIHAPNGTGKSSLFEAMRRALFDAHNVGGAEIEAIRPWGRRLAPTVYVEFAEKGKTYRVEKTFLDSASSKLFREEGGTFQPVADGRNADIDLRKLLSAEAPGRGLSKQEHWGLAQILWAPQGELPLSQISGGAAESLRSALGVQVSGASGGRLDELIEERYLEFFTRNGGLKKGKNAAPIIPLQEKLDELRKQQGELQQKQLSYEETSRQVEDARNRREQARREAGALRESLTKLRATAEEYARLKREQTGKKEKSDLARERYETLGRTLKEIKETRESIHTLKESVETLAAQSKEAEQEVVAAKKVLEGKRTARESARNRRTQTGEGQKLIEAAREYLSCREALGKLDKRLEKLREVEEELAGARKERGDRVSPDAKTIRELRKHVGEREAARAALAASQIHLTVTPRNACSIENLTDSSTHTVEPGESVAFAGDEVVEVSIQGFGSVRASGPEGGAEAHRAELDAAEKRITKLSQPFGSADPDHLQKQREEAEALGQRIATLQKQIETILDGDERDDFDQTKRALEARITAFEKGHPDWKTEAPVVSRLQADFEKLNREISDAIAAAEDGFDRQQNACTVMEQRQLDIQGRLKVDRSHLETAEKRLAVLTQDGLSDAEREKAQSEALMSWQASKKEAAAAEDQLKAIPGDPGRELEKLEKQCKAMEEAEANARDQEKTAEGRLDNLAAQGTYSQLTICEEALAEVETAIHRETLRMDAVRLLRDTVQGIKGAMMASIAAPVEKTATRMWERIVGPRLGEVRLNQEFVPEAISPEIADGPVNLQNLSGGEQEQLHLVARLSLADLLAREQRQLVVLDDVLNATDSGRLRRLLTLLEEVSERLQLVILTCHPERYQALEDATFFELSR